MEYYFNHYDNMRNRPKVLKLREEMGASGYGIYLMILERICQGHKRDDKATAAEINVDVEDVRRVIEDYGLFESEEV